MTLGEDLIEIDDDTQADCARQTRRYTRKKIGISDQYSLFLRNGPPQSDRSQPRDQCELDYD